MDYADFMQTRVFVPLGLTHTSVGIEPGLEAYAAQRYDQKQRPLPFYDFDHRGASAVYASAHDLVRFGMFHLKDRLPDVRRVIRDSTIDHMQRAVPPASYGLGWIIADRDGLRIKYRTGGMPGVQTVLILYPDEDIAIVALTNAVFAPPPELLGEWEGSVRTWDRVLPMTLSVRAGGDIHARLGANLESVVNEAHWQDKTLTGRFAATIPTIDASRWPHNVLLSLRVRNGVLGGMASALSTTDPAYYALTSYVSLTPKGAMK